MSMCTIVERGAAINTHTDWPEGMAEAQAIRQAYDRWAWGLQGKIEVRHAPKTCWDYPDEIIELSGPTIDAARRHTSKQYQHGFVLAWFLPESPQRTRLIESQATAQL